MAEAAAASIPETNPDPEPGTDPGGGKNGGSFGRGGCEALWLWYEEGRGSAGGEGSTLGSISWKSVSWIS